MGKDNKVVIVKSSAPRGQEHAGSSRTHATYVSVTCYDDTSVLFDKKTHEHKRIGRQRASEVAIFVSLGELG
jgi:hypothetical protein